MPRFDCALIKPLIGHRLPPLKAAKFPQKHPPTPTIKVIRVGHGYDLHRLEPLTPVGQGKPFILGGICIEHDRGPVGHSDGDALLHAITDAILGALALPDIGQLFPDTDPRWAGKDSAHFLRHALELMREKKFEVCNLDATVICERPKIGPVKEKIKSHRAHLLGCHVGQINVKGKTHEHVDAVGEGRAIEVHCVELLTSI